LKLSVHKADIYLLVRIVGDLDLLSAPVFRSRVDEEMKKTGIPNIILNLRGLNFIDSTGLGVLLGRHKQILSYGGKMILCDVPAKVISMLDMAGLGRVLPVAGSEKEAVSQLSSCPAQRRCSR
jgi:stage II sporulation protein AA (anti-sigma F factor antagonist)